MVFHKRDIFLLGLFGFRVPAHMETPQLHFSDPELKQLQRGDTMVVQIKPTRDHRIFCSSSDQGVQRLQGNVGTSERRMVLLFPP